jgi:hypothetical protein
MKLGGRLLSQNANPETHERLSMMLITTASLPNPITPLGMMTMTRLGFPESRRQIGDLHNN